MPDFHQKIDQLRDTLVGVVPQPEGQIAQITYALIYKFMNDFDAESVALGGRRAYFAEDFEKYAWHHLMRPQLDARAREALYAEALDKMSANPALPPLFRDIFRDARLPYKNPLTCDLFLKQIDDGFSHAANVHTDDIGDAYEYLLQATGAQGGVGQFRTPRHIIQFIVDCVAPAATDTILDPAVGTAGFLIAAYKHILAKHSPVRGKTAPLTADQRARLHTNFRGFDIDPTMVRTAQVNLYLHGFKTPKILPHDTLTSEDYWDERYDIILANPPFMTPKGGIQPHKKFSVPANRSEVLFTDYIATHLKPKGRAGFIVPEGIIFQSGNAYKQLRKALVEQHGLFAVISLPGGVFQPYSGVKTTILLLDPARAKTTDSILFLKIANDGFSLGAQRRPIPVNDLPGALKIVQAFQRGNLTRSREEREEASSAVAAHAAGTFAPSREINYQLVPKAEIAATGDYNLSGDRYAKQQTQTSKFPFVALGEVAEINPLKFQLKNIPDATLVSFVPMANLPNKNEPFIAQEIKPLGELRNKYTYFADGDVLVAKVTPCLENGKVGLAQNLANGIGFGSSEYFVIRADKEKVLPEFLYQFIASETFRKNGVKVMTGTGGLQRIPRSFVESFQIPLPPLEIQRDIVSRIATKQRAIAAAREVIAALETERHHFDPRPRAHRENWPTVKLGDVCERFQYGSSKKSNTAGDVPCLRMGNLQNGEIDWSDLKYAPEDENVAVYLLRDGDILFNRTNSAELVGKTSIFKGTRKAVFAGYLIRIHYKKSKLLGGYLNACLNTADFKAFCQRVKTDGVSQSNINAKLLATYEIPLPPLSIQREYIAEFEQENAIKTANQTLLALMERKIAATLAELWEGSES